MNDTQTGSERLFELLSKAMAASPQIAQRVNAHIRAVSGHTTIIGFMRNGSAEEEKKRICAECLVAIRTNNFEKLQGQVAAGQAVGEAQPEPEPEPEVKPRQKRPPAPAGDRGGSEPVPEPAEAPAGRPERNSTAPEAAGDPAAQLATALRAIMGQPKVEIDEGRLVALVGEKIAEAETRLSEAASQRIEEYLKSIPPRESIEVRRGSEIVEIEGATHWQIPQVITWVGANIPLWLWGQAGGGKTTIGRQIAQALGLEPYIISIDPTTTIGKLLGFRNLASGEFVEGFLYKPFKNGGLVKFDEIDTGDAGILASLNALIANDHYLFPNGETVKRHPDFRVIAGANTKGCGAVAGYTARNRLDAATLDRFAVLELTYDEDLERSLALLAPKASLKKWERVENPPEKLLAWVDWVQSVRRSVGTSVLVSPRASILGTRALRAGIPPAEVAEALVFKLVSDDTKANIINRCGNFV